MKNIITLALMALILVAYSAEAKKKKKEKYSFQVMKGKIKGFSERFIEIDQESIEFDINADYVTVQFKKVAEFPHNYTPRIEELVVSSMKDEKGEPKVKLTTRAYKPSDAIAKLNDLIKQSVGSTVKVKLYNQSYFEMEELKQPKLKWLAISELTIINQSELDEAIDFVLQVKKIVNSENKKKLKELFYSDYVFPNGESWNYFKEIKDLDEIYLPIDKEYMQKLTRENLMKGYYTVYSNVKSNNIKYFNFYYDEYYNAYCLSFMDTHIEFIEDETEGDGSGGMIYFAKVNGKFKIVNIDVAG